MLMECDDLVTIHKFCSMLPAFVFEVHPVIPVEEAVRGELGGHRLARWAETPLTIGLHSAR
jgi:hypothetical protein